MAGTWEVRRDVLLEAIRLLDLVPSQSGVPSSDFFMVVPDGEFKVWMSTAAGAIANVKIDGTGIWPYKKPFYLDRRLFTPFVSTFREIKNKFNFEFSRTENGDLRVRCGRPFEDFSPQPSVMGYGEVPKLTDAAKLVISEDLLALMKSAAGYAASEAGAPHLACVYLIPSKNGLELLASNQKTLFRAKYVGGHSFKEPIPFPPSMLSVIQAEGLKELVWSKPCVFARFAKGVVWQSISAQAERDFPAVEIRDSMIRGRKIIPAFTAKASKFARVMERLSLYLQYVRKEDQVVGISGTKGSETVFLVVRLPNTIIHETLVVMEPLKTAFKFDWPLDQVSGMFGGEVVEVRLEPEAGVSYVKCGLIELAMSTKRV